MTDKVSRGKYWEDRAAEYLKEKGYKILDRNFRCREGEIDLIAYRRSTLIFVEVRGRESGNFMDPVDSIDRYKMRRVLKAAALYLNRGEHVKKWKEVRIDVIAVTDDGLNHIKGAFSLEEAGFDSMWGGFYA